MPRRVDGRHLRGCRAAPGLSTRDGADALAGRGVGLDAAACAVREIGGQITIQSRDGLGCAVHLEIPGPDRNAPNSPPAARSDKRHRRGRRR